MKLYDDFVGGLNPPPMRINIDGPAGTGRSYLIDMISVHLRERSQLAGKADPVPDGNRGVQYSGKDHPQPSSFTCKKGL